MKESEQDETATSAIKWGISSALVASLCCLGPLVLILFGVGGASTALAIGYRKPYFLLLGALVLGIGFYRLHSKSCRQKNLTRKQQLVVFGGSFITALLLYYLLAFVVTPLIAPTVFQWRLGK